MHPQVHCVKVTDTHYLRYAMTHLELLVPGHDIKQSSADLDRQLGERIRVVGVF